jgi:hypothetical protein
LAGETTKQGGATGGKLHLRGQTRACLATSDCSQAVQETCCCLGTALVASGKRGEILSERLARASGVGATKASRLDQQDQCPALTGKTMDAASEPAMSCRRLGLTQGTPVAFAGRNKRDGDMLALLLD